VTRLPKSGSIAMPAAGKSRGRKGAGFTVGAFSASAIQGIQAAGTTTLQGIADELNRRGIPTAAGRGEWQPVQVSRVLARLAD
jgi:hypothetical protein